MVQPFIVDLTEVKWTKPVYERAEVERCGEMLRQVGDLAATPDTPEFAHALAVVNNWKAAHHYPLNHMYNNLRNYACKATGRDDPLTSQRVKRIQSIHAKLRDKAAISLLNMQDLGGCRAIVDSIAQVYAIRDLHVKGRAGHKLWQLPVDYLAKPRHTGYRGIHLLYEYMASEVHAAYDNMRIEIQLRTRIQHWWATATEVMTFVRGEPLKSGKGDPKWLRMFALIGSAFALLEKTAPVRDTPTDMISLRREIRDLDQELDFRRAISAFPAGVDFAGGQLSGRGYHYFLLILDLAKRQEPRLFVRGYTPQDVAKAEQELEKEQNAGPNRDVVLVAASGIKNLKKAYPNYRLDTQLFLTKVNEVLNGNGESVKR